MRLVDLFLQYCFGVSRSRSFWAELIYCKAFSVSPLFIYSPQNHEVVPHIMPVVRSFFQRYKGYGTKPFYETKDGGTAGYYVNTKGLKRARPTTIKYAVMC